MFEQHDPLKKQRRRSHAERLALAEQIRPFGDRGAAWEDIGRLFGITGSYAKRLYFDPSGEKLRARERERAQKR